MNNNETIYSNNIIVCSSLGSDSLLNKLGYKYKTSPVLGQVLELEIKGNFPNLNNWPAVISINNFNLIPKEKNIILMGATMEPGDNPSHSNLVNMKNMNGSAPKWLKEATIKNQWSGLRAKPCDQPAPILEKIEDGLIIATGHYRNGVLLAPATAEWIANKLKEMD